MYSNIILPESGKAVRLNSSAGRSLLKDYVLMYLSQNQLGGSRTIIMPTQEDIEVIESKYMQDYSTKQTIKFKLKNEYCLKNGIRERHQYYIDEIDIFQGTNESRLRKSHYEEGHPNFKANLHNMVFYPIFNFTLSMLLVPSIENVSNINDTQFEEEIMEPIYSFCAKVAKYEFHEYELKDRARLINGELVTETQLSDIVSKKNETDNSVVKEKVNLLFQKGRMIIQNYRQKLNKSATDVIYAEEFQTEFFEYFEKVMRQCVYTFLQKRLADVMEKTSPVPLEPKLFENQMISPRVVYRFRSHLKKNGFQASEKSPVVPKYSTYGDGGRVKNIREDWPKPKPEYESAYAVLNKLLSDPE